MASPAYVTTDFVQDVRDAAALPNSSVPGVDNLTILRIADAQLRSHVVPQLCRVSEEYYIKRFDILGTVGVGTYRLPTRAAGASARTIQFLLGSIPPGGITTSLLYSLERVAPDRLPTFQPTDQYRGLPWAFYMEAATINLVPVPASQITLRVRVQHRPGKLVLDTDNAQGAVITSVGTSVVGGVNCYQIGTASFTRTGQQAGDIISGTNPFEVLASATINQGGTSQFPQSDFTTAPQVGDWLTLPDVSPVVQVPVELEPVVAGLTAAAILRAKNRKGHAEDIFKEAMTSMKETLSVMAPRTKGNVKVQTGGIWNKLRGPVVGGRY
jgi:hypothetical protein